MNDKQMEWCRLVASGRFTKSEAYREAYGKPDMTNDAARKAAHRLSQKEDVSRMLDKLRENRNTGAVMSREERKQALSRSIVKCENDEKFGDMRALISELNRMDGAYAPEQVEVDAKVGVAGLVMALQERGCRPGESGAGNAD